MAKRNKGLYEIIVTTNDDTNYIYNFDNMDAAWAFNYEALALKHKGKVKAVKNCGYPTMLYVDPETALNHLRINLLCK